MAVFISVTTNAFEEEFSRRQGEGRPPTRNLNIRRPLRGIEIKRDTYSVMKVIDFAGRELPLINSSSPTEEDGIGQSTHYANFIIVNISEQRVEKQQIVETFGEDFIFFFGERPRTLNIQGLVFNTNDFNWKSEFWENYEKTLRGTKLLEKNARLYLYFDDVVVEGYLLQATMEMSAQTPYHLPLQMQLFVTNYAILSDVGSVRFPVRTNSTLSEPSWNSTDEGRSGFTGSVASPDITADQLPGKVSGGGLNSFLSSAAQFGSAGSFSIQATLETIKNTFYGRRVVTPSGGSQLFVPTIDNQAKFNAPPGGGASVERRVPIHQMSDEFVEREAIQPQFDRNELARVRKELQLREPKQLEEEARKQLKELGVDVTPPSTNYLLLGRAAFAGLQIMGSFGMRQADGALNLPGQLP